jgi:protein-disulfide isomerase
VGGAERNARKKRQQTAAGRTVASARASGTDRTKIIVGVVVVLLIAGVVLGGVLYTNAQKSKTEGQVIAPNTTASTVAYPARRDAAVVVAGKDDAKATIDVYEDFLCPFCARFETTNAAAMDRAMADGNLRVRYHLVAILKDKSDPAGYSLDAANAALCAADAGPFPAFHASLYKAQPEEGARGYDKSQLTKLGNDLGITAPDFTSCVQSGKYNQQVQAAQDQIKKTPYLQQDFGNGEKGFGTPTVTLGEKIIDVTDPAWLDKLLAQP